MVATCSCGRSGDQTLDTTPSKVIAAWIRQLPNSLRMRKAPLRALSFQAAGVEFPGLPVSVAQAQVAARAGQPIGYEPDFYFWHLGSSGL